MSDSLPRARWSRDREGATELPAAERWVLGVVLVHLCFLPWALGTMHLWSQTVSLGLAALGFALALRPRVLASAAEPGKRIVLHPWRRLVRFPGFWLGLAVLAYVAVQGLNPAWRYRANAAYWWLEALPHVRWLPHGMEVPFAQAGPWRALILLGAGWATVCTVWIGLSRRRAWRLLFIVLAVNGVALAGLEAAQQLTHTKRIFWTVASSNPAFAASFVYRNHAGAYLNLMVAVAAGLAWWYHERACRRFEKSSPAPVFLFAALVTSLMVVFTLSRGSAILLAALVGLAGGAFLWRHCRRPAHERNHLVALGLAVLLAGFVGTGLYALRVEKVRQRLATLLSAADESAYNRAEARAAAQEMLAARGLLGWGAGCFRYKFPEYARLHPDIHYKGTGQRSFWEHAHNDLLQFPIEFGLAGTALLVVAPLGWLAVTAWRRRAWRNPLALLLLLGCSLTVAHGWMDFVFQNPAILFTWAVLLIGAVRWAEVDEDRGVRSE